MSTVPRLVPDLVLPPYTFVPGRQPHPVRDPAGHQFGRVRGVASPLDSNDWWTNRAYLWGFDLFNRGYFWESHETWESLWHAAGRKGTTADFVKGLIKLAAAGVKHLEGVPNGTTSHSVRAAELWREIAASLGPKNDFLYGLRLTELIELAEAVGRQGWPLEPPVLLPTMPNGAGSVSDALGEDVADASGS